MSAGTISIIKGDDTTLAFTFSNSDASAFDLTGCTVFLTVKKSINDLDTNAVISKTVTSHTDPTHGKTSIVVTHTDSAIAARGYKYDIQVKDSGGNIRSSGAGEFVVAPEVTQRAA